jgi:four helix bundle protein
MKTNNLEERLIQFAISIALFNEALPNSKSANHLGSQLLRSGTSPALNYGEARGAESKKDFIHKMKICLKELRESHNCLRILAGANPKIGQPTFRPVLEECNQLIAIFVKSLLTANASDRR